MKLNAYRKRSPWIMHYNAGSCNGCDIEILALLGPKYDLERFGVLNTGNPKQSDILLVTGPVTKRCREPLVEIWSQMPEPKVVISCGTCASTGGIFRGMYNVEDGVDKLIPVDVYVAGCAAHPKQILDGVLKAVEILAEKNKEIELPKALVGAVREDSGQIDRRDLAAKIETPELPEPESGDQQEETRP